MGTILKVPASEVALARVGKGSCNVAQLPLSSGREMVWKDWETAAQAKGWSGEKKIITTL